MEPNQNAFIDVRCGACRKTFGWFGTMLDRPACPECGHDLSAEEKAANEAAFDDLRKAVKERHRKLTELCAGELKHAYDAGIEMAKVHPPKPLGPGLASIAAAEAMDACPYQRTTKRGAADDGLDEYAAWIRGYWAAERSTEK